MPNLDSERPKLEAYLARLRGELRVEALVVFGSFARGESSRESDLDIAVVSPDLAGISWPRRIQRLYDQWPGGRACDVIGFTPEELLEARRMLAWEVLDEGVPVYDAGVFAAARDGLRARIARGDLARTAIGWRERAPAP